METAMKKPFSIPTETEENEKILPAETPMPVLKTVLYLAGILLLCAATHFSGGLLFLPAGIIASAMFAQALLRGGEILPKILSTAVLLLLWPISGSFTAALTISFLFLPAGLGIAVSFKQRKGFTTAMAASLLFAAVFAIPMAFTAMAEFTRGFSMAELLNNIGSIVKNNFSAFFGMLPQELSQIFLSSLGISSTGTLSDVLYANLIYSLPGTVCLFLLLTFSFAYWLFRWLCIKQAPPQMRDSYYFMSHFYLVRISTVAAMIYMLTSLLTFMSLEYEDAMFFSNLLNIFSYVFAYEGIAVVDYLLYRRFKAHTAVRTLAILFLGGLCILPLGASSLLSLIGIADSCWNLRRFIPAKEGYVV